MKKVLIALFVALALLAIAFYGIGKGWFGTREGPGVIEGAAIPAAAVDERENVQRAAAVAVGLEAPKQILFGDLHVHTTVSFDAFAGSLPLMQGEGPHPIADACDFARYCAALDFWSINDHAEAMTPQTWDDTIASVRQCNELAGDSSDPDLVSFLGWEWTQVGATPDEHYGHKNVVLRDLEDGSIPTRPISSGGIAVRVLRSGGPTLGQRVGLFLRERDSRFLDFATYLEERAGIPTCPDGVPAPELPASCGEDAETPQELFRKLDEWGHEAVVIPHGTTWGFYTPTGASWDKQLTSQQHDPDRQTLIEVYSGHGNSEEYRPWREVERTTDPMEGCPAPVAGEALPCWRFGELIERRCLEVGKREAECAQEAAAARSQAAEVGSPICPEPSAGFLPTCWRAGELIEERCLAEGESPAECAERGAEGRLIAANMSVAGHYTVSGEEPEDWLEAGQCVDCFQPSFGYRPGSSVQYIMALRNFEDPEVDRFRFGFMASSDNHTARPGTGYKEYGRQYTTEAVVLGQYGLAAPPPRPASSEATTIRRTGPAEVTLDSTTVLNGFQIVDRERAASFFYTGGLMAAHSTGRDRSSIWEAMERREVYGTSGPRILLWFDLLQADGEALPMGSQVASTETPRFEVRAVGSFEQRPGCPELSTQALSPERLERLCRGECYHPSDVRRPITRIEVVRIRPRVAPDEPMETLIEDPWRVLECEGDSAGCVVTFEDPDYADVQRDTVYYVRAIEVPSPAVNADPVPCVRRDESGRCVEVDLCFGDKTRTPPDEDCLAPAEQRAWSSPIFVDWAKEATMEEAR